MKKTTLLLRIYGEKTDEQWTLINLEFALASQADTWDEARAILTSQIKQYLADALTGQDQPHAAALLTRRAPIKYWFKYWLSVTRTRLGGAVNGREMAVIEPLPMVPG